MDYHQFVKDVQEQAGCQEKDEALKAIQATLQTLGERLFDGEAEELAAQLPRELQQYLKEPENRSNFQVEEFLQRVGRREGTTPQIAEKHAKGVIAVLCRAVSQGEIEDVLSQLPESYWKLFGKESRMVH